MLLERDKQFKQLTFIPHATLPSNKIIMTIVIYRLAAFNIKKPTQHQTNDLRYPRESFPNQKHCITHINDIRGRFFNESTSLPTGT